MTRLPLALGLLVWLSLGKLPALADAFDRYAEAELAKLAATEKVVEVAQIGAREVERYGGLIGGSSAAFAIVRTNGGQWSKMLIQFARQKIGEDTRPIALVERARTYQAGGGSVLAATIPDLRLFDGFLLNLDLGQIVPGEVGADLRYAADDGDGTLVPVGKAKLYIVATHLDEVVKRAATRKPVGDTFTAQDLAGRYRMHDDGRRVAEIHLRVDADGKIAGEYISEQTGRRYEIEGQAQVPPHKLQFSVTFPQSVQIFTGWCFTRDASTLTGFSSLQGRETGFYATRIEGD